MPGISLTAAATWPGPHQTRSRCSNWCTELALRARAIWAQDRLFYQTLVCPLLSSALRPSARLSRTVHHTPTPCYFRSCQLGAAVGHEAMVELLSMHWRPRAAYLCVTWHGSRTRFGGARSARVTDGVQSPGAQLQLGDELIALSVYSSVPVHLPSSLVPPLHLSTLQTSSCLPP